MDHRKTLILLILCTAWLVSGCNRRCQSPGGCGPFANSRIPAPGTGQLTIPSRSAQQPYYVPGGGLAQNQVIDPNQSAPTLNQPNPQLNGWTPQPATGGPSFVASNAPVYNSQPYVGGPGSGVPPGYRVATSSTLPSSQSTLDSGQSRTSGQNERTDPTRLPATDATAVRAPAANTASASFLPPTLQPRYSASLNAFQPIAPPQMAGGNPTGQPRYQAQPMTAAAPSYQSPYVRTVPQMAQNAPGSPVGWTPRDGDRDTNR